MRIFRDLLFLHGHVADPRTARDLADAPDAHHAPRRAVAAAPDTPRGAEAAAAATPARDAEPGGNLPPASPVGRPA